ncbi:hypothetical protein Ae201684P_003110 [Aphanomyces euteiches]|nr:hypothetical protein Ae201684P_003110 [Aphanomyces euteiches]KAH9138271.1 hypothetical protein AeRB84_017392 [Aphanomyces euteiches]
MGRTRGKGKAPSKRELELQVAAMREQLESISNTSSVASQAQDVVSVKHFATDHGTKRPPTLQNVHYSDRMVEILMEHRYETFGSKFLQQTSNAQRAVLWEKMCIKFSIATNQHVSVVSLKNKLSNLRKEYNRLAAA